MLLLLFNAQLTSNLLGNWNIATAVSLTRSSLNPNLWNTTLTLQVPLSTVYRPASLLSPTPVKCLSFGAVEYRYMTSTLAGQLVAETGSVHSIDMEAAYASFQRKLLKKRSAGVVVIDEWTMKLEVEDTFDRGVMVKT
jgi:hypothetical protein